MDHDSYYIQHTGCPRCQSNGHDTNNDNLATYKNINKETNDEYITAYCWACNHYFKQDELSKELTSKTKKEITQQSKTINHTTKLLINIGEYKALITRDIPADICQKFKYSWSEYNYEPVQIVNLFNDKGLIEAQKVRLRNKKFFWLGNSKKYSTYLFGKDVFAPTDKVGIVITEGEIDCMTWASLDDGRYPVVTNLNGAGGLYDAIKANLEYLNKFKSITFMLDGDVAGREAAKKCAALFSYEKVRIAELPDGEDISSLYLSHGREYLKHLYYNARPCLPDDIVKLSDYTREELYAPDPYGYPIPFPKLNNMLRGIKSSRIYLVCGGTGLGKSAFIKEIVFRLAKEKSICIGNIFLEQNDKEAMKDFIAMDNGVHPDLFLDNPEIIDDDAKRYSEFFINDSMYFFRHFGGLNSDVLLKKIEYMMIGLDCQLIVLDHISMAIEGDTEVSDDNKNATVFMTKLRVLTERTGVPVLGVVHLRKSQGAKDYSEGAQVTLRDISGTGNITKIADFVIALERNQLEESKVTMTHVLKSRRGGKVGYADKLLYDSSTGRLNAIAEVSHG